MKFDVPSYNLAELTAGEAAATSGEWVLGLFAAVIASMFAAVAAWEIMR
ncbi:hypothetical protein [Bradyrhizobium elkanii]|nr:hypothetical protein [Bradyrhizobium elkanii]MCS3453786.1 hypothetical protein [Bradyrhizobium elkanii]MCS3566938.1 hypothetical protein [Bradyrhizobium elkanii]MCW2153838.1 hypothetical protein [Bradyrhizobium elkanii]MCW2380329.1 hypothetical protein [Bradyrhizobium elkanii]WLC12672.1 hypothetical protein QIH86_45320 [Bradyrhizobium elkanii USDA 94]